MVLDKTEIKIRYIIEDFIEPGIDKSRPMSSGTSRLPSWARNYLTSLAQQVRFRACHTTGKQWPWVSKMGGRLV